MSEESKNLVSLQIKITKKVYEQLQEQLKVFQAHRIKGIEDNSKVEDLIVFFITQFMTGEEKMRKFEDRMQNVLNALKDKGVDILDLFNTFSQKFPDEENENESDTRKNDQDINVEKKKS